MENETITSAVCPQCGAPLTEADENGNMKCKFCGAISLDKRHSFVHTTRDFEAELAHYLENAEELISDGEYEIAFKKFKEIAEQYSKDYRGWWGMARALTFDFTEPDLSEESYKEVCRYCKSALAKAPDDKKEELEIFFNEYNDIITKANQDLLRIYKKIERDERLIALSFPASVAVYTIFMFVYSIIYILINNPELGNAGGSIVGVVIPPVIFGVAYGIWAMVHDSDNAIFGIYAAAVLSTLAWEGAWLLLLQKVELVNFIMMFIVFAISLLPGYFMTRKARGY